jgi:uroporphyrinogen decarboxylase
MSASKRSTNQITPRERVLTALQHIEPDRVPVDFLATPEIWVKLVEQLGPDTNSIGHSDYFDPTWEALLRMLEIDCRVLSYDQFCQPPESIMYANAEVNWWDALSRSTPNRMWRQRTTEGDIYDIWGHHINIAENPTGAYEEFASWPLDSAETINDLKAYPWPKPDWWDFSSLPLILEHLDQTEAYHIRFRIGSVFEIAWQLRGMEQFMLDLALNPTIPEYIMDRLTDVYVENTRCVLELAGDRLDMFYFYDDIASQSSLLISQKMWRELVKPRHERILEVIKAYDKPVMYHCDGAVYPLIPELIDMGIDVLNPIQPDAKGMESKHLKDEFGDQLCFHGGIDIIETLPEGNVDDVKAEVQDRVQVLGKDGGYILASSHHIQSDTPIPNVLAMYEPALRYRN